MALYIAHTHKHMSTYTYTINTLKWIFLDASLSEDIKFILMSKFPFIKTIFLVKKYFCAKFSGKSNLGL